MSDELFDFVVHVKRHESNPDPNCDWCPWPADEDEKP